MDGQNRRDFLRLAAGGSATAMLTGGLIERALAIAPASRSGSIMDVEHVVVLMQENRSFDHYFGMLNGVRGFGDPRPLRLPGGRSVWAQPSGQHGDGHVLPYHGDSRATRSFLVDGAEQSHVENVHIFHQGRFDRWGHTGELHNRMLHYAAADLPFYYALADAFTVCDAYHASTMTQTYPNRLHLFTGCNGGGTVGGDPQMENYGEDLTPSADMATDRPLDPAAYRWTTYAERLQAAGIDWKVYQEYDNFGDNLLSVFPAFRPCDKAGELYRRGRAWVSEGLTGGERTRSDGDHLVAAFRADIAAGKLPQVSWIVTAADLSEHPTAEPAKGEHLTARLIEALIDHPEVFAKTVLILNYDEAGGFFDHMPPPVPPVGRYKGASTVPLDGEAKDYRGSGQAGDEAHPLGLGIRTPTVIVSPWSRGGHVCSQLFDHTSVIRFLEARFGVREPNISAWRRAVCGDLTSAFDFEQAPVLQAPHLPQTSDFRARVARSAEGSATAIPARQQPTAQMAGQRGHRPLAYALSAECAVEDGQLTIVLANTGKLGAVITAHDNADRIAPHHFTVGAGASLAAPWEAGGPRHDLTLHGPNGFWRRFAGTHEDLGEQAVRLIERPHLDAVEIVLANRSGRGQRFTLDFGAAYAVSGARQRAVTVAPGRTARELWRLGASDNWYDIAVSSGGALWHYAGKVDNGRPGRTDPAIGAMRV